MSISMNAATTAIQAPPPRTTQISLSEEQIEIISDTLAEFDPDNLSQADSMAIIERFNNAGIQPSKELAHAMDEAGFNAKNIGDAARTEDPSTNGMAPPPPQTDVSFSEEMTSTLEELLDEYSDKILTEKNKEEILSTMQNKFSLTKGNSLISIEA